MSFKLEDVFFKIKEVEDDNYISEEENVWALMCTNISIYFFFGLILLLLLIFEFIFYFPFK
jgi:hypothetical protein